MQKHSSDRDNRTPLDYRSAGVDIDAGEEAKNRLSRLVESTFTAGTRGAFGGWNRQRGPSTGR